MNRVPCKSCPWRVGSNADEIPNFSPALAESLSGTCSGELGAAIFACHLSKPEEEFPCAGWLARYGWDSLAVRLNLINGKDWMDFLTHDGKIPENWPEIYETFDEMIENLRETYTGGNE